MTCLSITGTAHHINRAQASFSVSVEQFVVGANTATSLTVHALLLPGLPWPHPVDHLPVPNQVVHFTGEVCMVNNNEASVVVDLLELRRV